MGLHPSALISILCLLAKANSQSQYIEVKLYPYREVKLDLTPEMEVFKMLFERCHSKNRNRSLKQHIKYLNFSVKFSWTTLYL